MENCIFDGKKMIHIWTYAGNSNYFPYEGMPCNCGKTKHKNYNAIGECEIGIDRQKITEENKKILNGHQ